MSQFSLLGLVLVNNAWLRIPVCPEWHIQRGFEVVQGSGMLQAEEQGIGRGQG